jgi:hypothetical protein
VKLVLSAPLSSPIHLGIVFKDMSYTLFQSLTHLENQVFPATESIKQLIETIARDVVRFRRNTQISYHFVARATSVCDEINNLIRKVDENDDWDSYDKFTEAIDLLEEWAGPLPRFSHADIFADFCSNRQKPSKMRCSTTLVGNRTSMDTFHRPRPGPITEQGCENFLTHFIPNQKLGWAHLQ